MKDRNENEQTPLDGASWKTVRAASNATIKAASASMDALTAAVREWTEARSDMEQAEAKVATIGQSGTAQIAATADRLRGEAARREEIEAGYGEAVMDKCGEVAAIHRELTGNHPALMQYATGEVEIDKPVTYVKGWTHEFAPKITDENRAAIVDFEPVLRDPPDTSALVVETGAEIVAIADMARAQKRYADANATLAAALKAYEDAKTALANEAATESASVEKAVAIQKERDTKPRTV